MATLAPASRKRLVSIIALLAVVSALGLVPWRLIARQAAASGDQQPPTNTSEITTAARRVEDPMATYPKTAMLQDVPPGAPGCNSYARGLETALNYSGTPADAATIMGDTGMAFIVMSEEGGPLIDGAVDVGWWPMASWGLEMRLDFLAQAIGREIRLIPADAAGYRADPARCYRDRFEREVKASIAAGKPVLVVHDMCFVVYGYDDNEPPLLGNWAPEDNQQTIRIERYPWALIVLGEQTDRLDRKEADLAALRHAVALARDEIQIRLPAYWAEWEPVTARYTGRKSYALWAQMLRDTEHLGQARWHSNMVFHLGLNRRNAVTYLRAMADRHPGQPAAHLRAAADLYQQVLALLETADTSETAMKSEQGREKLARLAETMAGIEAQAATHIEQALAAAPAGL